MKTKITKIAATKFDSSINKSVRYFHAGSAWIETLELFIDHENEMAWAVFWVKPWIISFCLELYVKSIASYEDNSFAEHHHKTGSIISENCKIPIFKKIKDNEELMKLVSEYDKNLGTKYGDTFVSLDGSEQQKLIDLIYELRDYMSKKTKLRF